MELETLAREVTETLKRKGLMLATAESCTGGWAAQAITAIAGSSEWFDRGFVSYTNLAKHEMLGVKPEILSHQGAVSEAAACAMAEGALARSHAQVALAITGIAGPTGGTPEKPVGTVCFAWAEKHCATRSQRVVFAGDRTAVRRQAVIFALRGLLSYLNTGPAPV